MSQGSIRTHAIVLRRTNYGEADRILQLLTPEYGKISVMAKGARKEKSKLAGGIELFAVSDVMIHRGKSNLGTLTGARLHTFFAHVLDNYEKMQFGYEVLKRVGGAVEMVPEPEWFELAKESFIGLNSTDIKLELVELYFYLHYAELLGYGLNLATDVEDKKLHKDETYVYDISEKGLRQTSQGNLTAEHIKLLRVANVKTPTVLAQISGLEAVTMDCLWVARKHAS